MNCRFCKTPLTHELIDLFNAPASNSFLKTEQLNQPETYFPLKVFVCDKCFLTQVDEYEKHEIIFDSEYVYYSSYSTSWLAHAKKYAEMMNNRFALNNSSLVVEIASNDGYLLQYFKEMGISILGIEPTSNTAEVAKQKGIDTRVDFFGTELASKLVAEGIKADVFAGNNVIAHVPDILDVVKGIKLILNDNGVVTLEFPHLMQLIDNNQFDTIYHEHFSYLSFHTIKKIFEACGLVMFDVEEITTHGGSLRIFAKHQENETITITENVQKLIEKETIKGMMTLAYYENFTQKALQIKLDLIGFLVTQKQQGKKVAGYGAAAKGNTLLNYCGIKSDLVDFVVDRNPHKQNKYLPASHIPVYDEAYLQKHKPDYVIIFPWNLKEEVIAQLSYIRSWNAKFVIPIPDLQIL